MNTYEVEYKQKNRFSFGKNWQSFSPNIDGERIAVAKSSLASFLGGENSISNKTFVDIGCGSGLSSLAAFLLGAKQIISVDVDEYSISCTKDLRKKYHNPKNWNVLSGSALDRKFLAGLDKFDIVYSWGVLHHTGDMYRAIDNTIGLANSRGVIYLAIYNRFTTRWHGGTSDYWLRLKQWFNKSNNITKMLALYVFMLYQFITIRIFQRINPISYITNYKKNRGMSWKHDLIDWLGGLPYEYASPDEIINYLGKKGWACKKLIFRNGIGCNEFLFVRV
jgi:2-polyprenyl-6-hydroxyphenyl methylase/3-demethylubiquinone-9 3-methyltransferase